MGSFPLDFLRRFLLRCFVRRFLRRRPARPPVPPPLRVEEYEDRIVPSALSMTDFVWPGVGNDAGTYPGHDGNAVDINQDTDKDGADRGTIVVAAQSGYVVLAVSGWSSGSGYGNHVVIAENADGSGIVFATAHLHAVAPEFVGASPTNPIRVSQGQVIGWEGSTGTGSPHVHTEVHLNAGPVTYNRLYQKGTPVAYTGTGDVANLLEARFYKGFLAATNRLTVSQHPEQLTSSLFPFLPANSARTAPVVMARPGLPIQFDFRAFDWSEQVALRMRNAAGDVQAVTITPAGNPFTTDNWTGVGLQTAPTRTITAPLAPGYYLLEAFERNPRYHAPGTSWSVGNGEFLDAVEINRATAPWPNPQPGDDLVAAAAMPVILIVDADAPADDYDTQFAEMRLGNQPTRIHTIGADRALLVAGSKKNDDTITLEKSGTQYTLTVNGAAYSFQDADFTSIFVDTGDGPGTTLVDMRDAPATKSVTVVGGAGIDIILGGQGNDVLVGGPGSDWIEGGPGNDRIFGNDGRDTLFSHTSVRRSLFANESTTQDHLFGEADIDQLFSRRNDEVFGGSIRDEFYGRPGETGTAYRPWGAQNVPPGLAGSVILVGDGTRNEFVVKAPQNTGVRLIDLDGYTFALSDSSFQMYTRLYVLPGADGDTVDLRNSPIPARVFVGGGNDTVYGTPQGDTISGGIGDDVLYGEGGNDTIGGKAGNDTIRGGANDDTLYGDAGEDDIDGGTETDYIDGRHEGADDNAADRLTGNGRSTIVLGVSDVNLHPGPDLEVIPPGQAAPANRPVVIDSYLVAYAGEALPSRAAPVESVSRAAVQISSFTVTPSLVPRGDSALFTLRTTGTGTWARLTLVHDRNNNGVYDAPDAVIGRFRPAAGGLRGQIGTEPFAPGVVNVLPVLEGYDGSVVVGSAIPLTVQDQLAALLPPGIAVMPDDVLSLIPHRNGDVTVVGNVLAGRGQIDVWEITPRTTGGFRFWTTGSTDTVVALYNAAGQRIGDPDDDSGPGENGEILVTLTADTTYYFAVACKTPDGGAYDLRVTGVNQTVAATIDTPPGAFTGSATGTITATHRLDYLQLVAPAGATLLDVSIETDPGLAVWVRVADSNSTVIGFAQPRRAGLDQLLTSLPVQGGKTYYVTIFGMYGTAGDYITTADFYPDEVGLPLTTTIPLLGEYEPLIVGADGDETLGGQAIDTPGQFRTYMISPRTSGEFVIQTTGSTDTMLAVYTGSGSQRLAWSDNDGGGGNARVTVELTGGQHYIVKVRGAGNATGPFAVRVNGADQFRRPITIAGLGYLGDDVASVAGNARVMYFSAVAPTSATTLDVSLTALSGWNFDGWFSIQDEAGNRTVVNTVGINTPDTIANFPVQGGKTYLFTVFGWNETTGSARLRLDFNPNVSGAGEIPLATTTFDTQRNPHVAMAPDGRAVAVWIGYKPNGASGDYEVYGQRFDAQAQPVGPEFLVNVDDTQDQEFATVAVDASGNFVVAWRTNGVVSARVYDAAGTPTGPEFLAGVSAQQGLAVAKQPGGSFLLIGGQSTQLVGRLFDPTGSPAGAAFVIDANNANNVSVAADGQGRYVLAWTRTQGASVAVHAARYSAAGTLVTPPFPVAPALATPQFESSVDAAASGAFVVAFRSFDAGPTGNNVYIQRFAADASPLGVLTRPHEYSTGTQDVPSVAMKDNTEVVVVWQSPNPQGGTGTEVYARHYDAAGNPADSEETRINEYTPNDQGRPWIATNGQQRFGLVWQSTMPAGSVDDVVGRFIDYATPTPRPVIRVSESAGTPDDAALPFGSFLQNALNPTQGVRVWNLGTTNLTGTAALAGAGAFSLIGPATFDLAPGQFQDYTVVLSTAARGAFTATLTVTSNSAVGTVPVAVTAAVVPPPDANEPNESAPAATNLGVVSVLSRTNLTLHRDQDEDWYVFTVARPSVLTVFTSFNHLEGDLDILLLDRHFGVLAAAASQVDQESMSVAVPGGQLLYLKAVAVGAAADVYDLHIREVTAPTADVRDVGPDPRASGVGTILFDFSEPVTGFDLSDLVLTRNGTAVAMTGATLTTTDNMTWTVGNLSGLTALDGVYELSLTGTGSGIADAAGNPFTDTVTDTWVKDTTTTTAVGAPGITYGAAGAVTVTVSSPLGTPDGTIQLIVGGTSTYTGTLSAGVHTFAVGVLGAGTHTLTANYLGSATWQPSTTAESLLVDRASLTVAADAQSKVYGAALPPLTFTTSGLVNGDTPATALTGALATTATAASGVGAYPITMGTLAAPNYTIAFTDSTLTVTRASLAATPTSGQTKVYGANLPVIGYTTAGLVNGDTPAAVLSGLLGSTATAASAVGGYAITGGTLAANANYTLTVTSGVTLAVTPAPLTVVADPKSKVYGGALPPLTFTTSGLVNGDTPASALTGALATTATDASGVGAYPVTAGTLAAANYTLSIADSTLVVTPAPLTLVADAQSKVYCAALPPLTFTTSGLVNGDTPGSALTGAPATTATAGSGVGGYLITTGTLAAPNYAVTFTDNTLTVTPAALTVAADAQSKVYGAAVPTLTFTTSGLVNGDTPATALTGAPATTATDASGVGAYPITMGTLAATNYAVTFADSTLTVTPAALTVAADAKSMTYGGAFPILTFTPAGLVNGDTAGTVLTGALTTSATAASSVNTYPVTQGTLSANANYNLSFAASTLTINKAPLTVFADPKSKVYGATLPTLTHQVAGLVNGDTAAAAVTVTLTTAATAASGVGVYPITAASPPAAANYTVTVVTDTLTVVPAALAVTAVPQTKLYGAAVPALTVAVAGLVNGDTPATALTGGLTTPAAAGSPTGAYAIDQGSLAAANYAITFAPGTLTVTAAPLSVTADAVTKLYGAALPGLTFAVAGLVNGDTASAVLAGALGTTGTAASPVGEYAVTRNSLTANGNYAITTFTDGRLTVTPAPLAVTADAATTVYGAALPTLSYSVAGLVNGDVAGGALTGTITTPATPASGVGSYPITRGSLAAANYAVAFTDAALLVTPAPLTVAADNAASLAAVTLPPFTYTVTGLVNGDGPAVVTGVTLATAATTASPAGTYPITASGGRADNYTVSFVPGTVTLRPSSALLGTTAFAVGADGGATVRVFNPDGTPRTTPPALGDGFAGGVRATTADVTGDNTPDLVVGTGPGRTAEVRVFDGTTGQLLSTRTPFADFRGGVFVAGADFNLDGFADVVITPDEGGGPRVSITSGKDGSVLANFFAIDDPNFRGGARAAAGDVNGDGTPDLVVSAGFGGGPRIAVYDGKSLGGTPTKLMNDFFAFEQGLRNGAYVAVGDLNADGKADLIFGGGPGGGPRVLALDAVKLMRGDMAGATLANFFAGNEDNRGGVRVAAKNLDGDARADLVVGDGAGAGSRVTTYLGKLLGPGSPPSRDTFDAFPDFLGGVFVG